MTPAAPVREAHAHGLRAVDDVVVGEDVALAIEHEARAGAAALRGLHLDRHDAGADALVQRGDVGGAARGCGRAGAAAAEGEAAAARAGGADVVERAADREAEDRQRDDEGAEQPGEEVGAAKVGSGAGGVRGWGER